MKRHILILSIILLFTACINDAYDTGKLSSEIELFQAGLRAPIGTATIRMDSLMKGLDLDSGLLVVENGVYTLRYTGEIEPEGLLDSLNGYDFPHFDPFQSSIPVYNATGETNLPYALPINQYRYSGTVYMNLPDFDSNRFDVDSVQLTHSLLRFEVNTIGLGGPKHNTNIRVHVQPQNDKALFTQSGQTIHSWNVLPATPTDVLCERLRLNDGLNRIAFDVDIFVDVTSSGDILITDAQQTYVQLLVSYPETVDYRMIWGQSTFSQQSQYASISLDALHSFIQASDTLSLYDPKIYVQTTSNVGIPFRMNLQLNSINQQTHATAQLETQQLIFPAAASTAPETTRHELNRTQGTDRLFRINPDQLTLAYDISSQTTPSIPHVLRKENQLHIQYGIDIPLQFKSDLLLHMNKVLDSPLGDLKALTEQEDLDASLHLSLSNRIPLRLRVQLTALDSDSLDLFTVTSGNIEAASPIDPLTGFALGATETVTNIELSKEQIDLLRYTQHFKVCFIVDNHRDHAFVSIQPEDYLHLSITAKLSGGVRLDLNP